MPGPNSLVGRLEKILPIVSGTSQNGAWQRRSFIVDIASQYPQKVCFGLWGDRVTMIDQFQEGTIIEVFFDLRSREYNERWYTEARAYQIGIPQQMPGAGPGMPPPNPAASYPPSQQQFPPQGNPISPNHDEGLDNDMNDLPF